MNYDIQSLLCHQVGGNNKQELGMCRGTKDSSFLWQPDRRTVLLSQHAECICVLFTIDIVIYRNFHMYCTAHVAKVCTCGANWS